MILAPPPAAIAAAQTQVISYLEHHHFTFPQMPGLVVADYRLTAAPALAGVTPVAVAAPGQVILSRQIAHAAISGETVAILLHEDLHETTTGGADDFASLTPVQVVANEAATEATTRDLLRGLLRASFPRLAYSYWQGMPTAYAGLVKRERVASARACRCGWTTPAARSWRAAYFLEAPAARELLR